MSGCDKCLTLGVLAPCDEHAPPWRRPAPAADRDAVLEEARRVASRQAEDPGLWFVGGTITEAYLQRALRQLHAAVEADSATPAPITPSAVDEAERRGAERATAQVVAWPRREAESYRVTARDDVQRLSHWRRQGFDRAADEWTGIADSIELGDHIPPATESEAGRG